MLNVIEEILKKRYPGEETYYLAKLLLEVSQRGSVSYKQIDIPEEIKDELLLFTYMERLIIPIKNSGTMQWKDRFLIFEEESIFEMPNVIRCLIQGVYEQGEWNTAYAIRKYLEEIGEVRIEDIILLVDKIKEMAENKKITSETIKNACSELNMDFDLDKTIAELKGGGIISPTLTGISGKLPSYEVNPVLY